jgi:hypothetical protein
MMKKYNIISLIIFAIVFYIIASSAIAVTPPDTIIVAGPSKSIASSDMAFWWTGKVTAPDASGRLPSIKGFYYSLDSEPWNWTQDRFIVCYGLPKGDHFLYVKAVDSNDQEDPTPALRTFTIEQSALAESNEGQSLFPISSGYVNDLNTKVLLDNLKQEFLIRGIQLSTSAIIEVITKDSKWQIIDGNKAYYIKKEVTDLSVYGVNNDTSSTAMVVPLNQNVQCQTFTAKDGADEDWFTVNVPKGTTTSPTPRQISIILNRPDAIVSSIVKIYRFPDISAGKEIASFEFKEKGFFATGIIPGDYYINIKPIAPSVPSAYSLTMTADSLATEIIWDKEDNNGSNNATETSPIFLSKSFPWIEIVGNRLSTVDNKDWFSVHANLTERKRMSLNLTRPRSGSTTVRLYSASPMSLLGEFTVTPDSGSQWKLELGAGLGDYLIEVDLSKYDSTFSTVWETPYFLTLLISDFPTGEVWELEPNNSPDFADRLNLGERIKASRNQPIDVDWFRLTIPRNGILNLTASRILKNGSMNISLLDSAGQPLDKIKLQNGDQKGSLNINVSAGEYFVNTDFADFTGEYWLNAVLFTSVEHNVPPDTTLFIGNNISVKLVWDKGNSASFDILYNNSTKKLTTEPIAMFDDGLHNDGNANDGLYVGNYIIKEKDNANDAIIIVHIKDTYNNVSDITITGKPILIDTTPPVISQVSHSAKEPLSIGEELVVTIKGEAGNKATFDVVSDSKDPLQRLIGIIAYDDGKHNDGSANDGTYTGNYIIKGGDYIIDGIVTGYLADTAGNTSSLSAVIKIDIVGDRPVINSVDHTGRLTLGQDEILTVTMIGDPEGIASFDIAGLKSNIPMYDDGKHNDGANGDGKYVGSYKVVDGDGVLSASLTAHLVDRKGKASSKVAQVKVNIDAVPPLPVTGVQCVDRPNDQGGYIIVTWKPATEIDFANYTIYLSNNPLAPFIKGELRTDKSLIVANVTDIKQTSIEIKIEENLADYYVAVTAVDIMGNESILDKSGGSVAGPVQAKDNLKPTPVKVVSAVDRDRDFGGFVIVSWTDSNIDEDFARYNIYQDIKPITSTQGLKPIDIITDRQLKIVDVSVESSTIDYYFAVTVIDLSDNESDLDKNSVAGPVKAENNIGTEPDSPLVFLSAPVGTIHHNNVAFHWNRFDYANDDRIKGYYTRLDSGNWQWTTDSDAVFYNLSAGDHKFSVRLPETMSAFTIERSFTIVPVTTSEQEPNNFIDKSSRLMTGVIVKGVGGDDDWYRIHIPPSSSPCIMDVLLSYTGASGSADISIYSDQPFQQVASAQSKGNNPVNLVFGVQPETDYLLKINSTVQYRLVATINKLASHYIWETENNNEIVNANDLTMGSNNPLTPFIKGELDAIEVHGLIESSSDFDWFKVHIPESVNNIPILSVSQYSGTPINTFIYSSLSGQNESLESDQIGEISDNNAIFNGIVKPGADYFIKLQGSVRTSYQFKLKLGEIKPDQNGLEVEPNDIIVQANPLNIGVKQRGTSWDGNNDVDIYKLTISKEGILNVQLSRPFGIGSSSIDVLNSASLVIGSFKVDLSNAQKNNINLNVKAGSYYLKIRPQKENSSAEYALVAMFVESIKVNYLSADGKEISTPLKAGDKIALEMKWEVKDGKAEFSIGEDDRRVVPMQLDAGIYKGSYTITQGDDISNQPIRVHITDNSANEADISAGFVGIIDSESPVIVEVSHDADAPLTSDKTLSVRMIGEARCKAKFDITGFKNGLDMFNMASTEAKPPLAILNWDWKFDPSVGTKGAIVISGEVKNISDSAKDLVRINYTLFEANGNIIGSGYGYTTPNRVSSGIIASFKIVADWTGKEKNAKIQLAYGSEQKIVGEVKDDYGVYTGIYDVGDNDNIKDGLIVCHLTDIAGNSSSASADITVTFDNIPPIINSIAYNADKVFTDGDSITIKLEGEADCEATFDIGTFKTGIQMSQIQGEGSYNENNPLTPFVKGEYIGVYRVKSGDKISGALIVAHLKDKAGNTATYAGAQSITINTSTPSISSVSFNSKIRPFIEGETLTVTATTEIGVTAVFDVENLVSSRPMFDDGKHSDGSAGDGVYTGSYIIKKGDNVRNAKIKVSTLSTNGKAGQRFALETVSVDTTPPLAISGVKAIDKPNDEGGYIILSWTPSVDLEFLEYRVYQSDQFITSVKGLTALDLDLDTQSTSSVEIKVNNPLTPFVKGELQIQYYFAVTTVDVATNESLLDRGSTAGPISSIDNLPPMPVAKVSGSDRKFDNGKVIVITWTQSSIAEDFNNYNIYMGRSPLNPPLSPFSKGGAEWTLADSSITDRNVRIANIVVPQDDIPFYFAVTAVDESGNESDITDDSVTGPISSKNDIGVEPETIVKIVSGPVGEINHNDVTFHWRRWFENGKDQSILPGYFYKLDDDNWVWTNDVSKTYHNLREGQHTFYVKADLGSEGVDPLPAVRIFSVKRISISESEPNNNADKSNWIAKGMTITGTSLDDNDADWFKFHVESTNPALMTLYFDKINGKGTTAVTVFRSLPPTQESALFSISVDTINRLSSISTGVEFGDYYVLVSSKGESPDTKYELSITADDLSQSQKGDIVQWDKENNDLPLLSQLIGRWNLGESNRPIEVTGFGNKDNDVDWYKLQITGIKPGMTAFMKVDFVRPRAGGSTDVSVYASLPFTESPKIGFIHYSPELLPVQTITMPVTSGDYFIKIENLKENYVNSLYSIRLSFSLSPDKWELEPNNISQFANTLLIGEVIKGTSWDPNNDLDWYKIRLDERKTLVVSMFKPFGKGATEIKLKSNDMIDIASATTSVLTGQKATISANLNVGDYYIVLKPSGETGTSAEYELTTAIIDTQSSIKSSEIDKNPNAPLTIGDSIMINITWSPNNIITYDIGDIRTDLPMFDDGKHDDAKATDGIYAGIYAIQSKDDLSNGVIKIHLGMPVGSARPRWTADFPLVDQVTGKNVSLNIDTTPPKIFTVDHDMPIKPISAGKVLKVIMTGESKAKSAFFSIQIPNNKLLLRNTEIQMKEDPSGTYTASYTVTDGDDISDGIVSCRLMDEAGNESTKSAIRTIAFDTIPPDITSIEHNAKKVLVDGDVLIVKALSDTKKGKATFNIGEFAKNLLMYDDGTRDDQVADDGIYTGRYTIKKGDNATDAIISVKLTDEAGNSFELLSRSPVSIDTIPPKIASFSHNAKDILSEGDKLIVTLKGDPGHIATFDIGEFKIGLPMYDDGTRGDDKATDGTYIGTYIVKKNDSIQDARVTGYLINKNGNQSISIIFERVSIDAVPPAPVVGVSAIDKPDDQGFWIILSWKPVTQLNDLGFPIFSDFDHYNIYRESAPITSILGLTPIIDDGTMNLEVMTTDHAEVNMPTNKTDFYFAVTAVDPAGNESLLDASKYGSTFGPVQSKDNIAPEPVRIVSAVDRPKDQGKTIIVSWTNPSRAEDFDHYAIYSSKEPIIALQGLKPLLLVTKRDLIDIQASDLGLETSDLGENSSITIRQIGIYVTISSDGVDFYFAVTAVDKSGNESALGEKGSVVGPVKSSDDIPPKPVILYDAVDTPGDNGGFIDVIWYPSEDEEIKQYNFYIADQLINREVIKTLKPLDAVEGKLAEPIKNTKFVTFRLEVPSEPIYIAITAVDFGGNESSLEESNNSIIGFVQAVSNVTRINSDTKIIAGFDANTSVLIPAGTFDNQETIDIFFPDDATFQKIDEANSFLEKSHIDSTIDSSFSDTVRLFQSSSSRLRKSVTITLSYPDATVIKDSTEQLSQNDELKFRIFKLNEASRLPRWELVAGQQEVDPVQNTVSVQIDTFGVFRVARLKLPENLGKVVVFPNPFIPSQSISGRITFKNLTENATIQIFSIDGQKVKTIEKIGGGDEVKWDAHNDKDEELVSGTYIFVIKNEVNTFTGKITILR